VKTLKTLAGYVLPNNLAEWVVFLAQVIVLAGIAAALHRCEVQLNVTGAAILANGAALLLIATQVAMEAVKQFHEREKIKLDERLRAEKALSHRRAARLEELGHQVY
jgi:hypothetical protein